MSRRIASPDGEQAGWPEVVGGVVGCLGAVAAWGTSQALAAVDPTVVGRGVTIPTDPLNTAWVVLVVLATAAVLISGGRPARGSSQRAVVASVAQVVTALALAVVVVGGAAFADAFYFTGPGDRCAQAGCWPLYPDLVLRSSPALLDGRRPRGCCCGAAAGALDRASGVTRCRVPRVRGRAAHRLGPAGRALVRGPRPVRPPRVHHPAIREEVPMNDPTRPTAGGPFDAGPAPRRWIRRCGGPGSRRRRAGSEIELTWDDRLYDVTAVTSSAPDGRDRLTRPRPAVRVDGHRATARVVPQAELGTAARLDQAQPTTLRLGLLRPPAFPDDLVTDAVPVTLRWQEPGVGQRELSLSRRLPPAGRPWGAEVGVSWGVHTWSPTRWAAYPLEVTLRSVGPAPLPAGTTVSLVVDPRLFAQLRLAHAVDVAGTAVGGDVRHRASSRASRASWRMRRALPAGAWVSLPVQVHPVTSTPLVDGAEAPLVQVVGPATHRAAQRLTGAECCTRADGLFAATIS